MVTSEMPTLPPMLRARLMSPGGAIHPFLGDEGKRDDVDGHEKEAEAAAGNHPDIDEGPETGGQIEVRELEHPGDRMSRPNITSQRGVIAREKPAHKRKSDQGDDGARGKHQATELRGVAHQGLQQNREEHGGAIQDHTEIET